MSLRQQTITGVAWSASGRIASQVGAFATSAVLARLLTPADFGLVGMIVVITGFASLFGELGFGAALVQSKEIEERHLSSVFWLNLGAGLLLAALTLACAPLIARFYHQPRLRSLAMALAANFVIQPFAMVQTAVLTRNMNFRALSIVEVAKLFVAGGIAIALALLGFGVWSLVVQSLVATSVGVLSLWLLSDWRPAWSFNLEAVHELVRYSTNLLGFQVLNYWIRHIDYLLIGRFIGARPLGVYTRAYTTMLLPLSQISNVLGRVMFPALSRIQNDRERVKRVYLRTISVIGLVAFPAMLGLMVVAQSFVLTIFGPKWVATIEILEIFCLLGLAQAVAATVGWLYQSQGKTDWMLYWGIGAGAVLVGSIVLGVHFGTATMVAACYTVASGGLLLYPTFAIPGRLIDMSFTDVLSCLLRPLAVATMMALVLSLIRKALPPSFVGWPTLAVLVPLGVGLYGAAIHLLRLEPYLELRRVLAGLRSRQPAAAPPPEDDERDDD